MSDLTNNFLFWKAMRESPPYGLDPNNRRRGWQRMETVAQKYARERRAARLWRWVKWVAVGAIFALAWVIYVGGSA